MKNYSGNQVLPPFSNNELCNLQDKVNEIEKRIKNNETMPTNIDIANANSLINNNTNNISNLQTQVTTNATNIANNAESIATLETSVETNATNIANSAERIASLESSVAGNTGSITTLQTAVQTNANDIATNQNDIINLQTTVNNNTQGIATNADATELLQTQVASNTCDIATMQATLTGLPNSGDITALQTSVATNTQNIATLQNGIATNAQNIAINTNSINNLTTSVDSCMQVFNEMSNNAGASPTPLFTIAGHSFGTPVYCMEDKYDTDFYTRLTNNKSKCLPVFFIGELHTKVKVNVSMKITSTVSSGVNTMVVEDNDEIIYKFTFAKSANVNLQLDFSFYLYNKTSYHKMVFYVNSSIKLYQTNLSVVLQGKNVCITSSKRKIKLNPCYDNTYLFYRTKDYFCQYQMASKENLNFDTGWQYVDNYELYEGNRHSLIQTYTIDANNQYQVDVKYLSYCQYASYYNTDLYLANLNTNTQEYMCGDTPFFKEMTVQNQFGRLVLPRFILEKDNFNDNPLARYMLTQGYTEIYGVPTLNNCGVRPLFYVDATTTIALKNATTNSHPVTGIYITESATVIFSASTSFNNTSYATWLNLGFGTQPFSCFADDDVHTIYVYLNRFGIIFEIILSVNDSTHKFEIISETAISYGDYLLKGYNNDKFIFLNDMVKIE